MTRFSTALAVLAIPLLLAGCTGSSEGEEASPESLVNRTLAALGAGHLAVAETSAERVAAADTPELASLGDFLLGNVAYAQCEIAGQQAATPEAEPFAFDIAIEFGKTALGAWKRAATHRDDWPEARRNAERALLLLESLERQKAEKVQDRRTNPTPRPLVLPRPSDEDDPEPEAPSTELTREQVLALLEKLGEKEKEKRDLRRTHRRERVAEVEKDW